MVQWPSGRRATHNFVGNRADDRAAVLARSRYRQLGKKSTATVIVVDDDASIRRALRRQLQILGFDVLDFGSAEEFLTSEIPAGEACLLLDVYMPGMTGIELCKKLTKDGGRPLPTILISGRDDPQTRKLMREAKPIASLIKPFDEKSLLRAIRKALPNQSNLPD